jgi:hypothetical protein
MPMQYVVIGWSDLENGEEEEKEEEEERRRRRRGGRGGGEEEEERRKRRRVSSWRQFVRTIQTRTRYEDIHGKKGDQKLRQRSGKEVWE